MNFFVTINWGCYLVTMGAIIFKNIPGGETYNLNISLGVWQRWRVGQSSYVTKTLCLYSLLQNDFVDLEEYPTWTDYVDKMESNGHWGDGVTLLAAARHLHCVVRVMSNRGFPDFFLRPASSNGDSEKPVELVLGHMFQNHFVSLEPGTALTPVELT